MSTESKSPKTLWHAMIGCFVHNRLMVAILTILLLGAGLAVHPFDDVDAKLRSWAPTLVGSLPRARVSVDAIPDIGVKQQIVFTTWEGRSPRDIEDQITYPLTTQLLGLPGVKTVRSSSMFGFSSIYVIFEDSVDFYWSRTRILEKLSALPKKNVLPEGATPVLGPDATALGQVFWYTLEGRDIETGHPTGGWDIQELRTIQDWTVRHALQASSGVSEVASIGGHVSEYQIDVDPKKLEAYGVSLLDLATAVRESNQDVGARTIEVNRVEYVVRGVGQLKTLAHIEDIVIVAHVDRPLRVKDVARVVLGPAGRRGALDVGGAEAVGGVVVARYGENPMEVIEKLKQKIGQLQPGLPRRTLSDGRVSQVTIVPFYDRSKVVNETLSTLSDALIQQVLITIVVVLILLGNLSSSLVISSILPLAVFATFLLMKATGVHANVMSLAGIAIAVGTMVDMGIVLTERMQEHFMEASTPQKRLQALVSGAVEVAPAMATSVATTILSFLPVFGLTASEGKLFYPLAYTKTYALLMAFLLSVFLLPTLASVMFAPCVHGLTQEELLAKPLTLRLLHMIGFATHKRYLVLMGAGVVLIWQSAWILGALVCVVSAVRILRGAMLQESGRKTLWLEHALVACSAMWLLTSSWMPLGYGEAWGANFGFVAGVLGGLLVIFWAFLRVYETLLSWTLEHKALFLVLPLSITLLGASVWLGFEDVFGWLFEPQERTQSTVYKRLKYAMPGLIEEFMPAFDEGEFLYMPSVMPHASFGQALEQLKLMDAAIMQIPEVEVAVGKMGRVDSALDPAPTSMFETLVTYKPEYRMERGQRRRQWREHIKSVDDIWNEIVRVTKQPGLTRAPKLMPIHTRIIMLQSGMRSAIGVKVQALDLASLERAGQSIEKVLKRSPVVRKGTMFAERVVGKPYLELRIDREKIAREGVSMSVVQRTLSVALSGMTLTTMYEGRARIDVRVRYARDDRMSVEALGELLVPTPRGVRVPLKQLAEVVYVKGPQVIKSENTFLTSYVSFDCAQGVSEVDAVKSLSALLDRAKTSGELKLPPGVRHEFAGSYQDQLRSKARLKVLYPLALLLIFLVLYVQFRAISTSVIIYTGVCVAVAGGFVLMGLYAQPWFLNVDVFGYNLRALFDVQPMNMSVAFWVGVIALVGIATDDGVVMATTLKQRFDAQDPKTVEDIRQLVLEAGKRRVRPCLMTTATTILALLPVMMSTGRGADVMRPMAIPSLGGMAVELITLFVVPVLFCAREEALLWWRNTR